MSKGIRQICNPGKISEIFGRLHAESQVVNDRFTIADKAVKNARVAILGFTFKENCPDTRNTRIIDIINELKEYGITPIVADPQADSSEARHLYGIEFVDMETVRDMDAIVLAVAHTEFTEITHVELDKYYGSGKRVLIDVKGILSREEFEQAGYCYWRL